MEAMVRVAAGPTFRHKPYRMGTMHLPSGRKVRLRAASYGLFRYTHALSLGQE